MSVYSILNANSGVGSLTSEIHISQAPQGISAPYIVLDFLTIQPENYLSERPNIENQLIGVECIGTTQKESLDLYRASLSALELFGAVKTVQIYGAIDPGTKLYRTLFDFSYWANR